MSSGLGAASATWSGPSALTLHMPGRALRGRGVRDPTSWSAPVYSKQAHRTHTPARTLCRTKLACSTMVLSRCSSYHIRRRAHYTCHAATYRTALRCKSSACTTLTVSTPEMPAVGKKSLLEDLRLPRNALNDLERGLGDAMTHLLFTRGGVGWWLVSGGARAEPNTKKQAQAMEIN